MPKKKVLKFKTADQKEYTVILRKPHKSLNADGICDNPELPKPKIYINPNLKERRMLAVIAEEYFHAFAFEKTEKEARKFAANLAKILYFLGWRLKK